MRECLRCGHNDRSTDSIYVGARSKYYSVCAHVAKHNKCQQHDCYKNWDGPPSSMETDIREQGFKKAKTNVVPIGVKEQHKQVMVTALYLPASL